MSLDPRFAAMVASLGPQRRGPTGVLHLSSPRAWLFAAVPAALVALLFAGTFFGREIEVTCTRTNPAQAGCDVDEQTVFYTIDSHHVPLADLERATLGVSVSRGSRGTTNTNATVTLHLAGTQDDLALNDYSWFEDVPAVQEATNRINGFITDPTQASIELRWGGHLTAWLCTLVLYGFASVGLFYAGFPRLKIEMDDSSERLRVDRLQGTLLREVTFHPIEGLAAVQVHAGQLWLRYENAPAVALPAIGGSASRLAAMAQRFGTFVGIQVAPPA